jgi:hypothetical protein
VPTARRLATAALVGGACGLAAAFVFVIVYAITNLYLSGHSIKPSWFDAVAGVMLFVVAAGTALGMGVIAWRAPGSRSP